MLYLLPFYIDALDDSDIEYFLIMIYTISADELDYDDEKLLRVGDERDVYFFITCTYMFILTTQCRYMAAPTNTSYSPLTEDE